MARDARLLDHDRDITTLLGSWRTGDSDAGEALMRLVYEQLRTIAGRLLNSEQPGHTFQPTDLVHEAYIRLAGANVQWNDRVHFFAIAARVMRRILVDHARSQLRAKRGGSPERLELQEIDGAVSLDDASMTRMLALDRALTELAGFDDRKSRLVEMTFFGGMSREETASALEISLPTLHRELKLAKAWLHVRLSEGFPQDAAR